MVPHVCTWVKLCRRGAAQNCVHFRKPTCTLDLLVNFGLDTAIPVHTRASGELCDFWKNQKFCEILPVGDWRLLALNQVNFLAQCACGKALCKFEQPTSLRTCFEKSWTLKNINFLKSSPRRAEGQILEQGPLQAYHRLFHYSNSVIGAY